MNGRGCYGSHRAGYGAYGSGYSYPAMVGAEPSGVSEVVKRYPTTTNFVLRTAVLALAGAMLGKIAAEEPKKAVVTGAFGGLVMSSVLWNLLPEAPH